jgi:hypothetical protein
MADFITPIQLDLDYLANEDRLLLTIKKNGEFSDWWLTRRLTSALVGAWIEKLELIGLPELTLAQLQSSQRNLPQEHALSLEFDGPQIKKPKIATPQNPMLIKEITISVTKIDCAIVLKAECKSTQLNLTRKEAHACLEMIASKSKQAGWLITLHWPNWLGHIS